MFIQVEAARSLSRRVSAYNQANPPGALQYSIAVKILGTETAFRVASMAIQLFGGYGLSKDFVVEKLFRDARASMIEDGVSETLALEGAEKLR
jgi:alkylation response protein AidB-like acyl-CoA dehydrogenase